MNHKTTVYSNPVLNHIVDNWPIGRNKTAKAIFTVEANAHS
jgi:hypothetical protein